MRTIVDPAATFVPAVERVFGVRPRVLPPALEDWIAMVEVEGDIELAVRRAKELLARA